MTRHPMNYAIAAALVSMLALAGCKKNDDTAAAPMATTPAIDTMPTTPTTPPAATAAMSATAGVVSLDFGTAVGADKKISAPGDTFKPTDTIYAAVTTMTSDASATVPGKLEAKWTFEDGQMVKDDTVDVQFNGNGVTDFSINNPTGFPPGKYQVEILLDGNVVQTKGFGVH